MTVLTFANVKGFIEYIVKKKIHRYGIIAYSKIDMGDKGIGLYSEYFRITTIDDKKKEIVRLDLPYYTNTYVTRQHNEKEAKEPKEKSLKWILKKVKELKPKGYRLKLLECEFTES